MSLPEMESPGDVVNIPAEVAELRALAKEILAQNDESDIPDALLQRGLNAMVKIYGAKWDKGERFEVFPEDNLPPATPTLLSVTRMMRAINIEVFELGMFQAWTGN